MSVFSVDENILTVQTIQIAPFRTTFGALKDMFFEINMEFKRDGLHIVNMDNTHTILANIYLDAKNFELYEIKREKIIIGVNMSHFYTLISSIENTETLTLYIENSDYTDGVVLNLGLKFENGKINHCTTQKLRLIEPDAEEINYPDVVFSSILNLPSVDFQKIVRNLLDISNKVEINLVGSELTFLSRGNFATCEIRRGESTKQLEFVKQIANDKIIQGEFSLKNLGYVIKCTPLCNQIEMHLENDLPLVIKYKVASLGVIYLYLSPLPSDK